MPSTRAGTDLSPGLTTGHVKCGTPVLVSRLVDIAIRSGFAFDSRGVFAGEEVATLEGHKNVVYAIAFNNPFGYVKTLYPCMQWRVW